MYFTKEQADYFIKLPKKIVEKERILDVKTIKQGFPVKIRFELISEQEPDLPFLWQIEQSAKNIIRISLHMQEDEKKTGLLRLDYNSSHTNPVFIKDTVPKEFHKFAGMRLFGNHIHYYVPGYKQLQWAIPLEFDNFPVKIIEENVKFSSTFIEIIDGFKNIINVQTELRIEERIL